MTRPIGLQPDDLAQVMASFGVAEAQVRRDHAISHILAALSRHRREDVIFIGGTALSRTYLLDQRLSEDIDLIAVEDRDDLAGVLINDIDTALARTHGRITWSPGWSRGSDVDPAVAVTRDGIAIKIQLLRGAGYEPWPTQTREIEQRYRDAPPAILRVPTLMAFAGWKTAAWLDRGAARDLNDLWALDRVGAFRTDGIGRVEKVLVVEPPPDPATHAADLIRSRFDAVTMEAPGTEKLWSLTAGSRAGKGITAQRHGRSQRCGGRGRYAA